MMHRAGDLVVWPSITSWPGGLGSSRLLHTSIYLCPTRKESKSRKSRSSVRVALGLPSPLRLPVRGYSIRSLVARRVQSARKAASLLDADVQVLAAKQLRTLIDADLFLITVPDDQIAGVARELSEIDADRKITALHTSGALSQ